MEIFMKSSWKNLELAQPVEEGYFVEEGMSEKKGELYQSWFEEEEKPSSNTVCEFRHYLD